VPGATTSTPPFPVGPAKKSQPAYDLAGKIVGTVVAVSFWLMFFGPRLDSIPAIHAKHLGEPLTGVFFVLLFVLLWADGVFDRWY
jgi:hypothetical protein